MATHIESSGDIEVYCFPSGRTPTRNSIPFFDSVTVGDRLALVFNPGDGAGPPYQLRITSPTGALIVDNILRDLPTGLPQSPPPVEFVVSVKGSYRVDIREMRGRQRGEATLKVT